MSKVAQWEVVLEHADHIGLYLHFKTQERENDQRFDGGDLGPERRLYYRELIARFSHHLALNWNLGEENTNTPAQRQAFAEFFASNDPYKSHVVIHNYPGVDDEEEIFQPLLGQTSLTGVSIQVKAWDVAESTHRWVTRSATSSHKWVVANDEQGPAGKGVIPDADDLNHDQIRKETLWGNLMTGGAGVEY